MSETIVEQVPHLSYESYIRNCTLKAAGERYNVFACIPCASSISAQKGQLEVNCKSHYHKVHCPKPGHYWCNSCMTNCGSILQGSNMKEIHKSTSSHNRARAKTVCLTCGTVNPLDSHGKGTHTIVSVDKVAATHKLEEFSLPTELQWLYQYCRAEAKTNNVICHVPCEDHFPVDLSRTGISVSIADGICNVCRLSKAPHPGHALELKFARPEIMRPAVKGSGDEPSEFLSKAAWSKLPEDLQDCYTLKKGTATLDKESYALYSASKRRQANSAPAPEAEAAADDSDSSEETQREAM